MKQTLDNKHLITYSNYFKIEDKTFAFKNKLLFDITNLPIKKELKDNNNCLGYWINRKWFTLSKLSNFIIREQIRVDVSELQWFEQINLELAL